MGRPPGSGGVPFLHLVLLGLLASHAMCVEAVELATTNDFFMQVCVTEPKARNGSKLGMTPSTVSAHSQSVQDALLNNLVDVKHALGRQLQVRLASNLLASAQLHAAAAASE